MKCIGTHKDTYGLGCRTEQPKRKLGLGIDCKCFSSFLLSKKGKERLNRAIIKVTKPRKELESLKKETKNRQGLTALIKSVVKVCHEFIRLRDKGKPCISCGTSYKADFDAGHYYSAGKFSNLKFNEYNIHGQCIQCNRYNEGNELNYRLYLPERIGLKKLDELDFLATEYKRLNCFEWNREDLKEKKNYYKQKIKNYKRR